MGLMRQQQGMASARLKLKTLNDNPYLNASLNWIVKCGKHLEFVLSPTIAFCPSEFDYSFVQLGGPTDINPWLTNYFVSLVIGYRF